MHDAGFIDKSLAQARVTGENHRTAFDCLIAVQLRQPPAHIEIQRDLIALFPSPGHGQITAGAHIGHRLAIDRHHRYLAPGRNTHRNGEFTALAGIDSQFDTALLGIVGLLA